ncbi:efflux RND transporter periplasmic adaptor subunit [bacterium]|nr:efflux RND transporter periplasmic adaptor subunit [bacterium]
MSSEIRRRRIIAVAIVLGAVAVLAVLVATRPRPDRQPPRAPATLVTVHEVRAEQPPIVVDAWGTVEPKRSVNLVAQVTGRVVAVSPNLQAGAFAEAGEVLLEIEDTDYRLAVQQARAQVAQAESNLATAREEARVAREEWQRARADADRDSPLREAEPTALVFREPQLRQAEASLEAARAALAQAELDLERCRVAAPFASRVIEEAVDPGDYVMTGSVLGRIDAIDMAEITINLPDRDLAWIQVPRTPGDPTEGSPVTVRGEFGGQLHSWPGQAVRLGGAIDRASRTVPVVIEVPEPYGSHDGRQPLVAGLFVEVEFRADPPAGTVTVPRRGLRPDDVVWVLDEDDRLQIRPVDVVHRGEDRVVLTGGIGPGDRLVTSNLQYVVEGMQLRAEDGVPTGLQATTTPKGASR